MELEGYESSEDDNMSIISDDQEDRLGSELSKEEEHHWPGKEHLTDWHTSSGSKAAHCDFHHHMDVIELGNRAS